MLDVGVVLALVAAMFMVGPALTFGVLALRGPHRHWDASRVPEMTEVDGSLVVFGPHARTGLDSQPDLRAGVWDAATLDLVWETPSLGTYEDGDHLHVHTGLLDRVVVTTSGRAEVQTRAVATGVLVDSGTLSDHAAGLCVSTDRTEAWVQAADGTVLHVDGQSGAVEAGEVAGWTECREAQEPQTCHPKGTLGETDCSPPGARARVHAFDGSTVMVGTRSPGTPWPLVSKEGVWTWTPGGVDQPEVETKAPVASGVVDGDVLLLYRVDDHTRLVRLSGDDGSAVYEVTVPDSDVGSAPGTFSVADGRVWVPHWTWLDAFDLDTGAPLGRIGRWR